MVDPRHERVLRTPDRSIVLTDGVVAIAVTLLALDLRPDLPSGASSDQLAHYLRAHGNQYFAFVLAFSLIARFWLIHHRVLDQVRRLDGAATQLNLLFLFGVTCLPLTTDIQGSYSSALATTLFAANLLLLSIAVTALADITHRRGLTADPDTDADRVARRWQMAGTATVPVIVIIVTWLLPHAEYFFLLYLVADLPARIARRRRRRRARAQSAGRSA